ncbi:MAG: CDP-alcohol phosphatidyltransferase family protein [Geminicoccaceae bacterium]|nr:CDP-alcohol phosphatidyltransferase family protein [Geminicoccaceae bacterium]
MLDGRLRPLIDPPLGRLGTFLARRRVTADLLTWAGFALSGLAMLLIAGGATLLGLLPLLLGRLADGLDGAVARVNGQTDKGGFLDITLDFIAYAGLVFAFALGDPVRNALPAAFLLFAFMGTGSSFLAFAVMAEKRGLVTEAQGKKSLYYLDGLTEGTETILFYVLACLLPAHFPLLAWIFGGLCWLTTAGRIATSMRTLRGTAGTAPGHQGISADKGTVP